MHVHNIKEGKEKKLGEHFMTKNLLLLNVTDLLDDTYSFG